MCATVTLCRHRSPSYCDDIHMANKSPKKKIGITWLMSPSKARRVDAASTAITSPGSIVTSS